MGGDSALILAYHAIEWGPRPLCVAPEQFARQLDVLTEAGAHTLTVAEAAAGLRSGNLPERSVAITFDDGFASVVEEAVPALLDRGMRATIFCVAGHLGGTNDWATQPPSAPRRRLAGAAQLAEAAALGFEIGSHGVEHVPLSRASEAELRSEIVDSRTALEQSLGRPVHSFAYPYGAQPRRGARPLLEATYLAACGTRLGRARAADDALALPRVDTHYVNRPALLARAAVGGLAPYLGARRHAAAIRRRVHPDFARGRQKSMAAGTVLSGR